MATTLANITKVPELRNRLLFTIGLLSIYRLGIFVATPGVDRSVMSEVIASSAGFLGLFNLFSGGALEQLKVGEVLISGHSCEMSSLVTFSVACWPAAPRSCVLCMKCGSTGLLPQAPVRPQVCTVEQK